MVQIFAVKLLSCSNSELDEGNTDIWYSRLLSGTFSNLQSNRILKNCRGLQITVRCENRPKCFKNLSDKIAVKIRETAGRAATWILTSYVSFIHLNSETNFHSAFVFVHIYHNSVHSKLTSWVALSPSYISFAYMHTTCIWMCVLTKYGFISIAFTCIVFGSVLFAFNIEMPLDSIDEHW